MTVYQALGRLARHPIEHLVRHWNWKAAVLSAAVRGSIFFAVSLPSGPGAAFKALGIDVPLRLAIAGLYGAIVQGLRRAEPAWAANVAAVIVIIALTHGLEFILHFLGDTPRLGTAIAISMAYSAASAVFNLYVMRRGVLIVGAGSGTLTEDLKRLPRLGLDFARLLVSLPWRAATSLREERHNRAGEHRPEG